MIHRKPSRKKGVELVFSISLIGATLFVSPSYAGISVNHVNSNPSLFHMKMNKKVQSKRPEWNGYLSSQGPVAMRFSDEEATKQRPPSPALPEFTVMANESDPYLIERPLPEDTIRARERLSEVVLELEPHSILSGKIEKDSGYDSQAPEALNIQESRGGALRSDEVLIFFEAGSEGNEANVLIPFSPALPSEKTVESSAKYIRKE